MTTTGRQVETGATGTTLTLQPYIFFYGRCAEALDFYKKIFGGTTEIMYVKDSPMKDDPNFGKDPNRVMHASFTSPDGLSFLCSDGMGNKTVDPEEGNVSIALDIRDGARAEKIC